MLFHLGDLSKHAYCAQTNPEYGRNPHSLNSEGKNVSKLNSQARSALHYHILHTYVYILTLHRTLNCYTITISKSSSSLWLLLHQYHTISLAGSSHQYSTGFFSQSTFSADSLTVSIQPLCAITCIKFCVHIKNPKHWQSHTYQCLVTVTQLYCTH